METYIELGSLVYDYKPCDRIFAQSKLTMDAIQSKHEGRGGAGALAAWAAAGSPSGGLVH
jgi:hypothetical protein